MKSAKEILSLARLNARMKAVYLSSLIYGLIPYETREVKTTSVTPGMVLLYNPDYIEQLSKDQAEIIEQATGLLFHEGFHVSNKHYDRQGDRNFKKWNQAADIPINSMIRGMGVSLPKNGIFPETYNLPNGLTAEQYYDLLPENSGKDGSVCSGDCGGGAGHSQGDIEKAVDEKIGRAPIEVELVQRQIVADTKKHMDQYGAGSVPQELAEWVKRFETPSKTRWEKELSHSIQNCVGRIETGGHDYSFSRPSRRSLIRGIIRPSLVQYQPDGAVIIDTSGSMGQEELSYALREVSTILVRLGLDSIWFLEADVDIAVEPKIITSSKLREVQLHGRGGTMFGPALKRLEKLRPRPVFAVYLTDGGHFDMPTKPQGIEVIWGLVPGPYSTIPQIPWGKVVHIEK